MGPFNRASSLVPTLPATEDTGFARFGAGPRVGALLSSGLLALSLAGCGAGTAAVGGVGSGAYLSGGIHGGRQPVANATVTIMEPGTAGYGTGNTVISTTTSNNGGQFTFPQPLVCPLNSGLVYLYITGGNAGAGTNNAIALAAILGPCSALGPSTFINVNEVTTVAAAYALAPFATVAGGAAGIGTSATNLQGLNNAAGAAANLASFATGVAHATGDFPGIVPPTAEVNTLANILSACVNQGVSTATTGTCASLFSAATPTGGSAPTDTFQAALNIAQHPSNNTSSLYTLSTPIVPFQPSLSSAPPDFSVALGFNGGGITAGAGTIGVAIDSAGYAWISTGGGSSAVHSLTEISPAGAYLSGSAVAGSTGFGSTSLSFPIGVAIDQGNNVYVANNGGGNLLKFNPNGTLQSTITATSFAGPNGLSVDAGGNVWVSNFSSSLNKTTKITAAGAEASNSPFTTVFGGVATASGPLAVWQSDYTSKLLNRIDLTSFAVTNYPLGLSTGGVAIDHANAAWFAATQDGNVYKISDAGVLLSPPASQGGFVAPNTSVQNIAIDGLGNAFAGAVTGGSTAGSLMQFTNSGTLVSPASGFYCSNVVPVVPQAPGGIDIDGSGNVWIAGTNNGSSVPNYVTEVVGIAAPAVTPKATAALNNTLGMRP